MSDLRAIPDRDLLCDRISDFGRLPTGWDGDDGTPPGPDVIEFARELVRKLPQSTELPQANPSADGEIGLTWFNGQKRLVAMLQPEGRLVWVKCLDDGPFVPGGEIDYHHDLSTFVQEVDNFYR